MATTTRQWQIAVGTGLVRVGIGAGLMTMRGFGARVLGADRDDDVVPAMLVGFGARDTLLGIAALAATRPGGNVAAQSKLQAGFDLVDAAVTGVMTATGRIAKWQGIAVTALSVGAFAVDYGLARAADRPAGLSLTG